MRTPQRRPRASKTKKAATTTPTTQAPDAPEAKKEPKYVFSQSDMIAEAPRIGAILREERKKRGWTQIELAKRSGLTQQVVEAYENGKSGTPTRLAQLALHLGLSLDSLYYGRKGTVSREYAEDLVPLIGSAAAGRWIEPDTLDPPEMIRRVECSKWSEPAQYALRLEGPSMNKTIPDGATVFCVAYAKSKRRPTSTDLVHAVLSRGDIEEWSIKRLKILDDGIIELRPESDDPRFEKPFVFDPSKPAGEFGPRLELRGFVLNFVANALPLI